MQSVCVHRRRERRQDLLAVSKGAERREPPGVQLRLASFLEQSLQCYTDQRPHEFKSDPALLLVLKRHK